MSNIKTRFIILCGARTGSTALTSTLKTHPDIHCYGHPFYVNPHGIVGLDDHLVTAVNMEKRDTVPLDYVRDILEHTQGPSIVGFKIWPLKSQGSKDAVDVLCADPLIKKVILNRENQLSCTSSTALVRLKKQNPDAFDNPDVRPQVDFDKSRFKREAQRRIRRYARYRKACQGDVLEIPYVGLMTTGIAAVTEFLGAAKHSFEAQTEKRNSGDIIGRYKPEYHDEIRATLDEIGHPEWVSEG